MAHVEALGWATQPAERPQCHDEAQASAPGSLDLVTPSSWPYIYPRHDEYLREPLVRRQGSQVCMREARAIPPVS